MMMSPSLCFALPLLCSPPLLSLACKREASEYGLQDRNGANENNCTHAGSSCWSPGTLVQAGLRMASSTAWRWLLLPSCKGKVSYSHELETWAAVVVFLLLWARWPPACPPRTSTAGPGKGRPAQKLRKMTRTMPAEYRLPFRLDRTSHSKPAAWLTLCSSAAAAARVSSPTALSLRRPVRKPLPADRRSRRPRERSAQQQTLLRRGEPSRGFSYYAEGAQQERKRRSLAT